MADYSKGKIYKILNTVDNEIYVGATIQTLSNRMSRHRTRCVNEFDANYGSKLYQHMRNVGINNCYIELIENYPCGSKEELNAREGQLIRDIATLNRKIEGRTNQEWREENKERVTQREHEYYIKNRESILEKQKQYYRANLDHVTELKKRQYQKDKDKRKEKRMCECGCFVCKYGMQQHLKSQKHSELMNKDTH